MQKYISNNKLLAPIFTTLLTSPLTNAFPNLMFKCAIPTKHKFEYVSAWLKSFNGSLLPTE